jgi:hypothetical protein
MIRYKFIDEKTVVPIDYNLELSVIKDEYEKTLEANEITDDEIISIKAKKKKKPKEKAKLELRLSIEDEFSKRIDKLGEFKDLAEEPYSDKDLGELDVLLPVYRQDRKSGKVIRSWKVEKNSSSLVLNKIDNLKKNLTKSDVKLNKYLEAQLLGTEMPYDVKSLISERQAQRDEINRLETLLENKDNVNFELRKK